MPNPHHLETEAIQHHLVFKDRQQRTAQHQAHSMNEACRVSICRICRVHRHLQTKVPSSTVQKKDIQIPDFFKKQINNEHKKRRCEFTASFLTSSKVSEPFREGSALTGEGITFCIAAFCGMTAGDINSGGGTFAVVVVGTFLSLTVDVDLFRSRSGELSRFMAEPEELRSRKLPQVVSSACRAFAPVISISPLEQSSFSLYIHFGCRTFENCHSLFPPDFFTDLCPYLTIRKKNKIYKKKTA